MEKKYSLRDVWEILESNNAKYTESFTSSCGKDYGKIDCFKLDNYGKICRVETNAETKYFTVIQEFDVRELLLSIENRTEYILSVFETYGQKGAEDKIGLQQDDVYIDEDGNIDKVMVYVVRTNFYYHGERHNFYCNPHGKTETVTYEEFLQLKQREDHDVCHLAPNEYRRPVLTAVRDDIDF